MGPTAPRRNMMAKYLLLKHYRGAPAPVNDVPMEQWTPEELSAHVQYMDDFADPLPSRVLCHSPPNFLQRVASILTCTRRSRLLRQVRQTSHLDRTRASCNAGHV